MQQKRFLPLFSCFRVILANYDSSTYYYNTLHCGEVFTDKIHMLQCKIQTNYRFLLWSLAWAIYSTLGPNLLNQQENKKKSNFFHWCWISRLISTLISKVNKHFLQSFVCVTVHFVTLTGKLDIVSWSEGSFFKQQYLRATVWTRCWCWVWSVCTAKLFSST